MKSLHVSAQEWNSEPVRLLVDAAAARRAALLGSGGLFDYAARAHGFVFFMAQVGEGFPDPPRVVKADQLELEVYWKSPNLSKQRIIGWRDRVELPTDIRYHRDHLGIVQNNFGDRIRLGDGTEARDVVHPLSRAGPEVYDYAIVDSISIVMPRRTVDVYRVAVRPKDLGLPGVIGSVFLEKSDASVVRFRFSFTASAYLDDDLEDITIALDNDLWDGRFWLPRHQEIEIRRRSAAFDIPMRGIIQGRWELTDYRMNVGLGDSLFGGHEIVAASAATRDSFVWSASLEEDMRDIDGPGLVVDLDRVREELGSVAGAQLRGGLPASRPGARSVSDLIRFSRVEGFAPGFGWTLRPAGTDISVFAHVRFGLEDRKLQGSARVTFPAFGGELEVAARSEVVDIGDEPASSGLLRSVLAQEGGNDLGDYVRLGRAAIRWRSPSGFLVSAGMVKASPLAVRTGSVTGTFRANPKLEQNWFPLLRTGVQSAASNYGHRRSVTWRIGGEAGFPEGRDYVRVRGSVRLSVPIGATDVRFRGWAGGGTAGLPDFRTFVLGGWGTLPGEPFRTWGGRRAAFGSLEWGVRVPVPEARIGQLVTTGSNIYIAPFVSFGVTGGRASGTPWLTTESPRVVLGLAIEPFNGLLRATVSRNLDAGAFGFTMDITRALWPIL